MSKHSNDDIAAVSAFAGVDLNYRTFDPEPVSGAAAFLETAAAIEAPTENRVLPFRAAPATPPVPRAKKAFFDDAKDVATDSGKHGTRWTDHLPAGSVSFTSLGGGAGVSTLQATLGKAFSLRGVRTLLADRTSHGILAHHFGATTEAWGRSVFQPSDPARQAPLTVLSGGPEETNINEIDFWRMIASHRGEIDCVLLEEWMPIAAESRAILAEEASRIVVLVPDPQTAIRIRRLDAEGLRGSYFLLNKFDPSVALHRDMHDWLHRRLGDRLIPVTLRRSDDIAVALAEGVTVLESAPASGIAQDFERLAEWVLDNINYKSRGEASV